MEIVYALKKETRKFEDINPGEVFLFNEYPYMKIKPEEECACTLSYGVHLETGELRFISRDTMVTPIESELRLTL